MPKPDFVRIQNVVVFQDLLILDVAAIFSIGYVIIIIITTVIMSLLSNALVTPASQEACLDLKSSCYHAEKCPEIEKSQTY